MDNLEILRKLLDEKIIRVLNMFLENSEESFSLTQISANSKVNNATTLRILSKLIDQKIVELNKIGKSKTYRLKPSQRTFFLSMIIKKETHLSEFIDLTTKLKGIEKIILESRSKDSAKMIFIASSDIKDKLEEMAKTTHEKYNYKINLIVMDEKQYTDMEKFGFDLSQKIIWEKK